MRRPRIPGPVEGVIREGTRSLEVRWIFSGQLNAEVTRWLGRFPSETQSLEDLYLVNPGSRGLSVKIRGGRALEVKEYGGSRGTLSVADRARGGLQAWQKWSFPFNPLNPGIGDPPGWTPVRKRRQITRFCWADGRITASALGLAGPARCAVELTAVRMAGQCWWSLGFETTGQADLQRSTLDATAELVFAAPLPDGLQPGLNESTSYAEWLIRRP